MTKHLRDCIRICEDAGLGVREARHRAKHLVVICDEGPVFFASTPSDWRWTRNARAFARRLARK